MASRLANAAVRLTGFYCEINQSDFFFFWSFEKSFLKIFKNEPKFDFLDGRAYIFLHLENINRKQRDSRLHLSVAVSGSNL